VEIRGPFRPIRTRVPGTQICEHLPRLAGLADRYSLIRSMRQPSADHLAGMHICLSGRSSPPENAPYFGSIVARLRPATKNIPPYVWLQNMEYDAGPRFQSGGLLGQAYAPLRVGTYEDNPSAAGFRFTAFDPPAGVSAAQLAGRRRLVTALDHAALPMAKAPAGDSVQRLRERAFDLVTGREARQAFDLSREPLAVRER
jgi:hypothetical protein